MRNDQAAEIDALRPGTHIGFLTPSAIRADADLANRESPRSVGDDPRTTLAQKMDALSQANPAGYAAVIMATNRMRKILPMMTPSGTISPARVLVIGVGVAGLQAIATAKRLGARRGQRYSPRSRRSGWVSGSKVYQSRPRGHRADRPRLRPRTHSRANENAAPRNDQSRPGGIIRTTAKLFGRKAPLILVQTVANQAGSIVIDFAVESGGNMWSKVGEEVLATDGVVIGPENLKAISKDVMHARFCFYNLIGTSGMRAKNFKFSEDDEIMKVVNYTWRPDRLRFQKVVEIAVPTF